jgi:HIV Tat-specific factor 1
VYVSGLPEEVEEEELLECFKVAGLFKLDAESGQPKLRMYKDEAGRPKP